MIICMQFRQNLRCRVLWLGRSVMECPMSQSLRTFCLSKYFALNIFFSCSCKRCHWLCLRLTSTLCSPMSASPKSRTFWLWPDLWRHQWPPGPNHTNMSPRPHVPISALWCPHVPIGCPYGHFRCVGGGPMPVSNSRIRRFRLAHR